MDERPRFAATGPGAFKALGLLRLASQALPIGGFSYSQGLETAIELGWVRSEADLIAWLRGLLGANIGSFEAPLMYKLAVVTTHGPLDEASFHRLNQLFLAARETSELRAETLQMGHSLLLVLAGLAFDRPAEAQDTLDPQAQSLLLASVQQGRVSLPAAWALAARAFRIDADLALTGYLWSWLENQVLAAQKALPLGQQAAQRVYSALSPQLSMVLERSPRLSEDDWSNFAPGFALASSWHECQYSRLFRS